MNSACFSTEIQMINEKDVAAIVGETKPFCQPPLSTPWFRNNISFPKNTIVETVKLRNKDVSVHFVKQRCSGLSYSFCRSAFYFESISDYVHTPSRLLCIYELFVYVNVYVCR